MNKWDDLGGKPLFLETSTAPQVAQAEAGLAALRQEHETPHLDKEAQ